MNAHVIVHCRKKRRTAGLAWLAVSEPVEEMCGTDLEYFGHKAHALTSEYCIGAGRLAQRGQQ